MFDATQTNRASARRPVLLDARCRKSSWAVNLVELENISEGGCCICGRMDGLVVDEEITLRIAGMAAIRGSVRWIEKRQAGISFLESLNAEAVEELASSYRIEQPHPAAIRSGLNAA